MQPSAAPEDGCQSARAHMLDMRNSVECSNGCTAEQVLRHRPSRRNCASPMIHRLDQLLAATQPSDSSFLRSTMRPFSTERRPRAEVSPLAAVSARTHALSMLHRVNECVSNREFDRGQDMTLLGNRKCDSTRALFFSLPGHYLLSAQRESV